MDETGYRFGRFDFIRKDGELWFLELNPNGQWAWLDEKNEHGLVSMVADAIKREDASHRSSIK
jgi:D-alanine-D-alanine ligase-like ATP-grasp enzyme